MGKMQETCCHLMSEEMELKGEPTVVANHTMDPEPDRGKRVQSRDKRNEKGMALENWN